MNYKSYLIPLFVACAVSATGANYFVSVAGLGGEPQYETEFSKWASDLDRELSANPDVHVTTLSGASATRQHLQEVLASLRTKISPDDTFALFLIGHGTFDGDDYKFNLPGPDVTARELGSWLSSIAAKRQLLVNMTSCSGASLAALARKDRIVITATKSGTEKNAPVFGRYWVDALRDPAADTDKNGTISAQEAFNYAQRKTAAYFEAQKLMATEHPLLTDSAHVESAPTPNSNRTSVLASAFPLVRPAAYSGKVTSPAKQHLVAKKEDLEAKIDRLKFEKAAMPAEAYRQQLSSLLLELARTQAEIDR